MKHKLAFRERSEPEEIRWCGAGLPRPCTRDPAVRGATARLQEVGGTSPPRAKRPSPGISNGRSGQKAGVLRSPRVARSLGATLPRRTGVAQVTGPLAFDRAADGTTSNIPWASLASGRSCLGSDHEPGSPAKRTIDVAAPRSLANAISCLPRNADSARHAPILEARFLDGLEEREDHR